MKYLSAALPAILAVFCFIGTPLPAAAADAVASTDGETAGTRLVVQEFKRVSGGAVMLRFIVTNDTDKDVDLYHLMIASEGATVDGIYLVDLAGKKKYEVVRDAEKHCLCSRGIPSQLAAKSSANLWAKFPAPPDNVEKIGIVAPHFIPMDDVPLAR
ncbi:MAG: hypothetical protein ACHQF3_04885 [Alphaproteobacteria bacterium]